MPAVVQNFEFGARNVSCHLLVVVQGRDGIFATAKHQSGTGYLPQGGAAVGANGEGTLLAANTRRTQVTDHRRKRPIESWIALPVVHSEEHGCVEFGQCRPVFGQCQFDGEGKMMGLGNLAFLPERRSAPGPDYRLLYKDAYTGGLEVDWNGTKIGLEFELCNYEIMLKKLKTLKKC